MLYNKIMLSNVYNNYNYLLKFIIVGDSSVGKSNLLMKFAYNKFTDDYQATVGVEFAAKNIKIEQEIFRVQVWDTAGQENFRSITRAYYKNSVCAMIVYDITNKKSFENVQRWIEDIRNQSPKTVLLVLVGNKTDLPDKRVITFDEGNEFAIKNGILFAETSAKTGEGVQEVFRKSVEDIAKKMSENFYDLNSEICGIKKGNNNNGEKDNSIDLENKKNKEEKKCC